MAPRKPVVLLVDEDDALRESVAQALEAEGYLCWGEPTADAALRRLEQGFRAPDAIVLDLWVPGMSAARFISHVKERATWSGAPIVLVTSTPEREVPATLGIDAVLPKPFRTARLLETLHEVLPPEAGTTGTAETAGREAQ